jgi:hypothetical protein
MTQLFGARDFALGYLTATTLGENRTAVLRMGVMLDAVDTVASLRQVRAGTLGPQGAVLVGAGAAAFAAVGLALIKDDGASRSQAPVANTISGQNLPGNTP